MFGSDKCHRSEIATVRLRGRVILRTAAVATMVLTLLLWAMSIRFSGWFGYGHSALGVYAGRVSFNQSEFLGTEEAIQRTGPILLRRIEGWHLQHVRLPWNSIESYGFIWPGTSRKTLSPPDSRWAVVIREKEIAVPLWLVFVITAAPLILTWKRARRFAPGRCGTCGYDLTGNVSGRCSECGWEVRP
jgi:hypothetical protein